MSEASHEENKERRHQAQERALHAKYNIIMFDDYGYSVITMETQCEIHGQEYTVYRFVDGLESVTPSEAVKAVVALNQGHTSEGDYVKT